MSYNISMWKTKRLKNLRVPLKAFFTSGRKDWHHRRVNEDDGTVTLEFCGCSGIRGELIDGMIHVSDIAFDSECSGFEMSEIVEPALRQSTGILEAVRIWEGGHSIDRLVVHDGIVTSVKVEL